MTKAVTFKTFSEAEAVMAPLYAARKVSAWNACKSFGLTVVRYQIGGAWFSLRQIDLAKLVA